VRDENGEWETADPAEKDFLSDKQNEEPNGAPACGPATNGSHEERAALSGSWRGKKNETNKNRSGVTRAQGRRNSGVHTELDWQDLTAGRSLRSRNVKRENRVDGRAGAGTRIP
jgi:hypothetical protein